MSAKYEIELRGLDGETISVTVFNPGAKTTLYIASIAPGETNVADNPKRYEKFFTAVVEKCTDTDPKIMNDISINEMIYLANSVSKVLKGEKPKYRGTRNHRMKEESIFDFNDNGTVDLSDWT